MTGAFDKEFQEGIRSIKVYWEECLTNTLPYYEHDAKKKMVMRHET